MRHCLLVLVLGAASWPLWPADWRPGLLAGWALALLLAAETIRRRQRVLAGRGRSGAMLQLLVGGFLARLLLLLLGGILGAYARLYPPASFLLAFLAAYLAGEVLGWWRLARHRPPPESDPRP